MFDKLPLLNLSKPSQISFNAEFAHLIAGHYENKNTGGYSYLDDFESTQSNFDLSDPYPWQLSSVPYDDGTPQLFPEAGLTNNIDYDKRFVQPLCPCYRDERVVPATAAKHE